MVVIKEQSILAIEIVRRNNKEIIRNIDRIKNVTIEALNTAVIVAKSLYKQKIVLNKINELEKSTNNFIKNTSDSISIQGENIYNIASNSTLESLQDAFKNVLNTINDVNIQNKKSFPENEIKIIELKKGEGYHEEV